MTLMLHLLELLAILGVSFLFGYALGRSSHYHTIRVYSETLHQCVELFSAALRRRVRLQDILRAPLPKLFDPGIANSGEDDHTPHQQDYKDE